MQQQNYTTKQTCIGILHNPAAPGAWKLDKEIMARVAFIERQGWKLQTVDAVHLPGTTRTYYDAKFIEVHQTDF